MLVLLLRYFCGTLWLLPAHCPSLLLLALMGAFMVLANALRQLPALPHTALLFLALVVVRWACAGALLRCPIIYR